MRRIPGSAHASENRCLCEVNNLYESLKTMFDCFFAKRVYNENVTNICSIWGETAMRTILHSDLNNFYASVECLYTPSLRDVPMAVCGDPEARHGIVLAKNMLAKRAGVQTGEAIWQARKKCPTLKTVPPNFERYLKFSREMKRIYAEYTDAVESFGLDECWLDVTGSGLDGEALAGELRRRAREELGLTVSVGVSWNKIFAKLGSDMKKPDATR